MLDFQNQNYTLLVLDSAKYTLAHNQEMGKRREGRY